jgi:hypothetical protein
MGASFYDGGENTALHTDLCSPLATDPTWRRLPASTRADLAAEGRPLWHELARALAPDLIIASIATAELDGITFPRLGDWRVVYTVERGSPLPVRAVKLEIVPGKATLLAFGQAAQTPFGTVSRHQRRLIGEALRRELDPR